MSLRTMLGADAYRVHEQVDALLDSEDGVIVPSTDHEPSVMRTHGFGISPCQLELLMVEIERAVRAIGAPKNNRRNRRNDGEACEKSDDSGRGAGVRRHLGRFGHGRNGRVVDRRSDGVRTGGSADSIVASLLVVYFDWREKLLRRMLAEPKDYRKAV